MVFEEQVDLSVKVEEILFDLKSNINPSTVKRYTKLGEKSPFFGVQMSVINRIAKANRKNTSLGVLLWETTILDAQLVAVEMFVPNELDQDCIKKFLNTDVSYTVLSKFVYKVLAKRNDRDFWLEFLLSRSEDNLQSLAWSIRIAKVKSGDYSFEDLSQIIDTITVLLVDSPEPIKWEMNRCLVEIAVKYEDFRDRIVRLGESLGVYADMKVSKGCTSAYIPDWVGALTTK